MADEHDDDNTDVDSKLFYQLRTNFLRDPISIH
jgi:hypothetical protein